MTEQYSPAVKLMSKQYDVRRQVRNLWKEEAAELIDAHMLAFSSLAAMIERFSGRFFDKQPENVEGRMNLIAQFALGVDPCEVAISEGLYSQAAALLKQELETLVAIDEFENLKRRDGKTPNVGNGTFRAFGEIYGDLNDIAHVAKRDIALSLVTIVQGDICAPSLLPIYDFNLAKSLYGYHTYFIVEVAKQSAKVFNEIFGEGMLEKESQAVLYSLMILLQHNVIQLPPEIKERFPDINNILVKPKTANNP